MKNNFVKNFTDLFLKIFDKIANLILRILGFKGFLEFVLVGCGSAYPPENLLNQSGRYADLPLQQANPNL